MLFIARRSDNEDGAVPPQPFGPVAGRSSNSGSSGYGLIGEQQLQSVPVKKTMAAAQTSKSAS
jgi:hypothetical protein